MRGAGRGAIAALAGCLATAAGAAPQGRDGDAGAKVGIVGGSAPCRAALIELLDPSTRVVERDRVDGRPSSNEPDAMERWIQASVKPGSVDLVLVLDAADAGTLRVLAFQGGRMVGLRHVEHRGCRLPPREAALTRAWLASRLLRPTRPTILATSAPPPSPEQPAPTLLVPKEPEESSEDEIRVDDAPPTRAEPRDPDEPLARPEPVDDPGVGRGAPPARVSPSAPAMPLEASLAAPTFAIAPSWLGLKLSAGLELVSHTFRWIEPRTANTRELRFDLVPAPRLSIELRPLGSLSAPWSSAVLAARFRGLFGVNARRTEGGEDRPLSAHDLEIALAYPVEVDLSERPLVVTPFVAYRDVRLSLGEDAKGQIEAGLPDAVYVGLEPGVAIDLRVQGRVHLRGRAAYHWVLGVDAQLARDFPDRSLHGVTLSAGLAFHPTPGLELGFSMEWLRYFIALAPQAEATRVAAGASDETLSVLAAATFAL